jgi:multidrug efflux pump subunit AcrB/ABC-type multidrug transport system ATPase subunit
MIGFIVKRPVLVAMILAGLSLLGVVSYTRLPVELIPYTELPMLIVQINGPNDANPEFVENEGVIPIESAIAGLDDIERIESYIDRRRAVIFVYYNQDSCQKYAYLKLQECVAANQSQMGENFSATVQKIDTSQLSNRIIVFQARGWGSLDQIRQVVDEKVVPDLESIDGIANVEVYGGRQHSIEVILDETELNAYDLTLSQVSSLISRGVSRRQYLGQATEGQKKIFVNLTTNYISTDQLEEVVIKEKGPLLLKHIATILDGGAEKESISRINGMEAITVSLVRSQDANLLSLAQKTRKAIRNLEEKVKPDGITLVIRDDEAKVIENNINDILVLALVGSLLAIAVLWVFLRDLALVIIAAAAIPISVLIAMNLFYAMGITINTLTLVGIAIAVGMLLDNSIVVLENIHRHIAAGKDAYQAVTTGTTEVWRAIFAATLTTVCVFIPFVFSGDYMMKTLGRQIGVSVISTLLVSLAVALLLIPAFSYRYFSRLNPSNKRFLRGGQGGSFFKKRPPGRWRHAYRQNRIMKIYRLFLKSCLRFPARTIIMGLVVFFISIILCLAVSVNVPEEVELDTFDLYAIMPSGTTIEAADEQVIAMDKLLERIGEIEERSANIQEDNIIFTFKLKENYEKIARRSLDRIKEEIYDMLTKAYPLVEFSYDQPQQNVRFRSGSGGSGRGGGGQSSARFARLLGIGTSQEKVVIRGQDFELMRSVAEDIQYNIDQLDTVRFSRLNVSSQQPGIDLSLDKSALSHFNVTLQSITGELSGFRKEITSGAKLKQGTEEINIIIKGKDERDKTPEDLRQLLIPSSSGGTIPILQLAQMVYSTGYSSINRVNQEKQVEVTFRFESDIEESKQLLEKARTSIEQIVANISPPPGVIIDIEHDESDFSEFYFLIFISILLIYMVLASTFESLHTPLSMMFTLPLATIGAFWGLILTGNSLFNASVLVGFLILLGVVVNNGIILIDYSCLLRKRNYRPSRALLEAGQARVRPILITTLTTVLAMLPVAMGEAEYISKIGAPFAVTVIGGLSAAMLFTLLLVPTVSFGLENALAWWRKLDWKIKLLQLAVFLGGAWVIYENVDSFLWQAVNATALLIAVPAFTYFVQKSLRRSVSTLISPGEPIKITIRNVVKLYDDYSRFMKEWRQGKQQQERSQKELSISNLVWQIPLYLFLFYFTYFYLEAGAWLLVFSILFYLYTLNLTRTLIKSFCRVQGILCAFFQKESLVSGGIFWILPLINLIWLRSRWDSILPVVLIGILWYLALAVYHTSRKLYSENINITRISGRFKGFRKAFYRFVKQIPLIGKQKVPFVALNRVSLEIGSGMFGLVGPNGAGKTTLMRIICGILQQTRGMVTFNHIDIDEKREELQSLIGYLPQEFGTYENMTAYNYLDYQALLKGLWDSGVRRKAVEFALSAVHLEDNRGNKIKTFSGGMKQRIGIAQTLLHLPRILVVDEPTAGLDPRERIKFRNLLSQLAQERIVIFSTHIIEDISSSCNRVAVLVEGKVKFLGTPQEMVDLARGYVWQARITEEEFAALRSSARIIHHLRDGEKIRARILALQKPLEHAEQVTPTLEDSYMWLLSDKSIERK